MNRWDVSEFKRQLATYLETNAVCTDDVESFIQANYNHLPLYYNDKYCRLDDIRECYEVHDLERVRFKLIKAPIDNIIGQGWLFEGSTTLDSKILANLIIGYLKSPDARLIQATFAMQLPNGKYFTSEGNHRIYAAFLLGISEVKLEIEQYAVERSVSTVKVPNGEGSSSR